MYVSVNPDNPEGFYGRWSYVLMSDPQRPGVALTTHISPKPGPNNMGVQSKSLLHNSY
jgi:hypothetical protein